MFGKKMSQIATKKDKNPKIFQFAKGLWIFFPNFRQTLSYATLKNVKMEKMCSPGCSEKRSTSKKTKFRNFCDVHYFRSVFVKI